MDETRAISKIEVKLPQEKNRLYQWHPPERSTVLEKVCVRE